MTSTAVIKPLNIYYQSGDMVFQNVSSNEICFTSNEFHNIVACLLVLTTLLRQLHTNLPKLKLKSMWGQLINNLRNWRNKIII